MGLVASIFRNLLGKPGASDFRDSADHFVAVMREFLHDIDQGGGLKNLAGANADSGGTGVGATWRFEAPSETLGPSARSSPRALRFTFEGGVPEIPLGYLTPGFRIFAPLSSNK